MAVNLKTLLETLNNTKTSTKKRATSVGPQYLGFDGGRYTINPKGWSIIAKSKRYPFEIQGNHVESSQTWNEIAIQVGEKSVISLNAQNALFSSNQEIVWKGTENPKQFVAQLKDADDHSCWIIKNGDNEYDIRILISLPNETNGRDKIDEDPFYANVRLHFYRNDSFNMISLSLVVPESHAKEMYDALIPALKQESFRKGLIRVGRPVPIDWSQDLNAIARKLGNKLGKKEQDELILAFNKLSICEEIPVPEVKMKAIDTSEARALIGNIDVMSEMDLNWIAERLANTPEEFKKDVAKFNEQWIAAQNEIKSQIGELSDRVVKLSTHQWIHLGEVQGESIYEIKCSIKTCHPDLCVCTHAPKIDHGYPNNCSDPLHLYVCSSSIDKTRFKTPKRTFHVGLWGYSGDLIQCTISITFVSACDPYEGRVIKV